MSESGTNKPVYDLEERTFLFVRKVRITLRKMKRDALNEDDMVQLINASESVGANYIEANESLSKKDFVYRIKICRNESKESAYWIRVLLETNVTELSGELSFIYNEAIELKKIF